MSLAAWKMQEAQDHLTEDAVNFHSNNLVQKEHVCASAYVLVILSPHCRGTK